MFQVAIFLSGFAIVSCVTYDYSRISLFTTTGIDIAASVYDSVDGSLFLAGSSTTAFQGTTNNGDSDIIVMKTDLKGAFSWVAQFGGQSSTDIGKGIVLSPDGTAVYVAGTTRNGFLGKTSSGSPNAFIVSLSAQNGSVLWVSVIDYGSSFDLKGLVIDSARQQLIIHGVDGSNLIQGYHRISDGSRTSRIAEGGDGSINAYALSHEAGVFYFTGKVARDFDGVNTQGGNSDIVISKRAFNGTRFWTKVVGSGDGEEGYAVVVDQVTSRIYIAGVTNADSLYGTSSIGRSAGGFLLAYDLRGSYLWFRRFGSSSTEAVNSIAIANGIIAVSGRTSGNFNGQTRGASTSGFFITYDTNGNVVDTTIDKSTSSSDFIGTIMEPPYALISSYGSIVLLTPRVASSSTSGSTMSGSTRSGTSASTVRSVSSSIVSSLKTSILGTGTNTVSTGVVVDVSPTDIGTQESMSSPAEPSEPSFDPGMPDPMSEDIIIVPSEETDASRSTGVTTKIGKTAGLSTEGFFLTTYQLIASAIGAAILVVLIATISALRYNKKKRPSLVPTVAMPRSSLEFNTKLVTDMNGNQSFYDPSQTSGGTTMAPTETGLSIPAYLRFESVDFRAIKKLTQGGGGEIILGEPMNKHLKNDSNKIVVKNVFAGPGTRDQESIMFYQEVALMNYLSACKNIAKLLGYIDSPPALLLKYYKYGSLREWVATKGWRNKTVLMAFFTDISKGLMFMHSKSLVHADIKPGNILVDEDEYGMLYCVITDFGITCIYDDSLMLVKGFVKAELQGASISYAAPEAIIRFRADIGSSTVPFQEAAAIDVYALSIIMYELLGIKAWTPKHTVSHMSLTQNSAKTATQTATSIREISSNNSRTGLNQ